MPGLRALIAVRRGYVVLLLACTLAVRLFVPAGYMPVAQHGTVTLAICSGTMSRPAVASPSMHHGAPSQEQHGKPEMPCAFAGLGMAALGAADAALLVAAILFAFLLASRAVALIQPAPPGRLRPPLRAPPLTA